jgi:hypothetical protein
VPDYVAMEIPLDKEQYSLNLNTGVDTSQDEDKSEKVEQFDKEQYSLQQGDCLGGDKIHVNF